jgi:RNA polymerase sigma factor (sigma-70 family)
MMPSAKVPRFEHDDAELVAQARRGDRDAFGRIVARYQALICALAYNATGNLVQSEDLAQESFVTAWKQLPALREPERLRSWLCGIVRNLGRRARRDEKHEPALRAESLETANFILAAPEPHPLDQTVSREEEEILWRHLEAIPESYREPLILFYREHASIEQVALALDLTEDTVRQRLSRGRRLLHQQVLAFVEGALARDSCGELSMVSEWDHDIRGQRCHPPIIEPKLNERRQLFMPGLQFRWFDAFQRGGCYCDHDDESRSAYKPFRPHDRRKEPATNGGLRVGRFWDHRFATSIDPSGRPCAGDVRGLKFPGCPDPDHF